MVDSSIITILISFKFKEPDLTFWPNSVSTASKIIYAQRSTGNPKIPEDIAGIAIEVQYSSSLALLRTPATQL